MARPATTLLHPLVAGATCVDLSVLVPVYNEQETLPELERRLAGVLDGLGLDCEVIAVNDGSADGTLALLRALRTWAGFRQTSLLYERDARYAGHTKYGLSKLFRLALDGIVSYSYVPLRVSYAFGLVVSGMSFILAVVYLFEKVFSTKYVPQGFTTLAILILFLGGVQLLTVGLLGEYVGRIYDEVKRRPDFVERELIGFDGAGRR